MVKPAYRTTRLRKKTYRTPGGKVKKAYLIKKYETPKCAACGIRIKRINKKNRPYAKELCHKCTERIIKIKTRLKNDDIKKEEVDIKYKKYVM